MKGILVINDSDDNWLESNDITFEKPPQTDVNLKIDKTGLNYVYKDDSLAFKPFYFEASNFMFECKGVKEIVLITEDNRIWKLLDCEVNYKDYKRFITFKRFKFLS